MDIQRYNNKENGMEEQSSSHPEWQPCLPSPIPEEPLTDAERGEKPPPPPPQSKRSRYRSPAVPYPEKTAQPEDTPKQNRSTILDRQVQKASGLFGVTSRGLIILLVLVLLLLLLLLIVIIMAALWPRQPYEEPVQICTSPSCLRAAAQVIESMNNETSPCKDFWNYACSNWIASNPMPPWASKWTVQEQLAHKAHEEMRSLIETMPHPTRPDSVAWKLKYFYESCTALEYIAVPEKTLIRNIDQMGGWGVLRSFSVYTWNFRMVLRRLHAEFGVNAFFRVDVAPHPYLQEKSIVRISPDGLGLPDRSYYYREPDHPTINTYKVFVKDAAQLLGAASPVALKFAEEVFHFEKRIAELTPNTEDIINPLNNVQLLTVADLQKQSFSIPWLEILRAIYPTTVFDDSTELLVTSADYLRDVSSIVSSTDRGTLNNYLMWRLAHKYLPYLSKEFWDVLDIHNKDMLGAKESLDRWEMCIKTSQNYFGLAMGALYSKNNAGLSDARYGVSVLFEKLRNTIANSVATSSKFSPGLRSRALEKINSMKLQIGYPGDLITNTYLDDVYSTMSVQVNDFLNNIMYGVHFLRKLEERTLLQPLPEHRWLAALQKDSISYVPEANTIVVPEHILRPPLFQLKYPTPLLFGTVGSQITAAMVSSISEHGILYDVNGILSERNSGVSNESLTLSGSQRKCVANSLTVRHIEDSPFVQRTMLDTLVQLAAVRQSLKAVNDLSMEQRRTHYKALEFLSHHELFFLSYAQSHCGTLTNKHEDMERSTTFHMGKEQLLRGILLQMPEFSSAFQCNASMPLYADKDTACEGIL